MKITHRYERTFPIQRNIYLDTNLFSGTLRTEHPMDQSQRLEPHQLPWRRRLRQAASFQEVSCHSIRRIQHRTHIEKYQW